MTRSLAIAACLVLITGGRPYAESLDQALVQAYLGNADLAAERSAVLATDELVPQALSGYRPQAFVSAGTQVNRGEQNLKSKFNVPTADGGSQRPNEDTNFTSTTTSLTVQQNLYAGGGTRATVSRAENLVRAERANLVATEQTVLLDAVTAYTNAWRDRAVLGEALNNEQRLQRQLQATRDRFEVGEVARTDVAQAEARLAGAQADVEAAKANVATSDATYRRVIGHLPGQLNQPAPLKLLPAGIDEAQALANANPDVIRATFNAAAAKDDVDVQFAAILPSIDLKGSVSYVLNPDQNTNHSYLGTVGVTVTIPLYQGGIEYARVRQSRQTYHQRRNQLESAYRTVQENVSSSWDQLLSSNAQVPAFRAEVRANEIALEGVQQEALVGTRTVLDVLDAEQELFTSRVSLVRAQAQEVSASYGVKSAVGQLTVTDLGLQVQPYDANVNYHKTRNRLVGVKTKQ